MSAILVIAFRLTSPERGDHTVAPQKRVAHLKTVDDYLAAVASGAVHAAWTRQKMERDARLSDRGGGGAVVDAADVNGYTDLRGGRATGLLLRPHACTSAR